MLKNKNFKINKRHCNLNIESKVVERTEKYLHWNNVIWYDLNI